MKSSIWLWLKGSGTAEDDSMW